METPKDISEELHFQEMALKAAKKQYEAAKNELSETRHIMETILQGISDGVILLSTDYRIVWANNAFLKDTGYDAASVTGRHCYKISHGKDSMCTPPHDVCPVEAVVRNKKSIRITHRHLDRSGRERLVEVTAYPIFNKNRDIIYFVHITRDITERVRLEEDLKRSQERGASG